MCAHTLPAHGHAHAIPRAVGQKKRKTSENATSEDRTKIRNTRKGLNHSTEEGEGLVDSKYTA
jgi:hypothetical protein